MFIRSSCDLDASKADKRLSSITSDGNYFTRVKKRAIFDGFSLAIHTSTIETPIAFIENAYI